MNILSLDIDFIKQCILYFDDIYLVEPKLIISHTSLDKPITFSYNIEQLINHLKPALDENILLINNTGVQIDLDLYKKAFGNDYIISLRPPDVFLTSDMNLDEQLTACVNQAKQIDKYCNFLNDNNIIAQILAFSLVKYQCISEINLFNGDTDNKKPVDFSYYKIFIPDVSSLSIDDILELRYYAKDELSEMREYLYHAFFTNKTYQDILKSVEQFERKIKNSKYSVFQKLISPKSYAPLIACAIANAPVQITALAAIAGLSADAYFEFLKQKNTLKNDSLYFYMKLKKKIY